MPGMMRWAWVVVLAVAGDAGAAEGPPTSRPATGPATRPVTMLRSPAAELVKQWWAEGTAAGNVGDSYDNRDREHSPLNMKDYPQLGKVGYGQAERNLRRDWAAQTQVLPPVVFGNSSTSAPATAGGSNPRMLYAHPRGLALLHAQMVRSNLYIYPEHQDHDPGHRGADGGGHGDLFPTNTPYLIISQGSSGSDGPFMRAMPLVLAAFRPEVKRKLVETGLLMPTVQMILRSTGKQLKAPEDYLTGRAHPTVFEGRDVDEVAMVKLAHGITLETIPPQVRLAVVREEPIGIDGRDFFEGAGVSERLSIDTPSVVARVWRGPWRERRMVVSAEQSSDVNGRALRIEWRVLRGEEGKVTVRKLNEAGTAAEIAAAYPERRPIAAGAAIESNRIDVGVFAHNGAHWSAPAFVTFLGLDAEARTYGEDGRIAEIGHGMGEPGVTVGDWGKMLEALDGEGPSAAARLLRERLGEAERTAGVAAIRAHLAEPKDASKKPEAARKAIEGALRGLMEDVNFAAAHAELLAAAVGEDPRKRHEHRRLREQLAGWGVLADAAAGWTLTPARARTAEGQGDAASRLTAYERMLVRRFNAEVLGVLLFPGAVTSSFRANYVDPAVTWPKAWRDVYEHDAATGRMAGWTRWDGTGPTVYTADGLAVTGRDALRRVTTARAVRYVREARSGQGPRALKVTMREGTVYYRYADEKDRVGRAVMRR